MVASQYGPTVTNEEIDRVGQDSSTAELFVKCDCGFEVRGTIEELIPIVQEHGIEAHNATVTDEQLLGSVRPAWPALHEGVVAPSKRWESTHTP